VPVTAGRALTVGVVVVAVVVELVVVVAGDEPSATTPVGALRTTWDAEPYVTSTRATSVWPTSALAGTYVDAAAPETAAQARPIVLQRSHE